ncbi:MULTISPECIES: type II and III secretion system protein family protein [unclassified Beijerinckia]|uniref:type II and III secretion system protein family protein n=1 Tax=unclassified Beijerinckia TaxID=2638183 RepID=UPI0008952569|nr:MULTISPECIES: type II and III secretion system protein family protein [unclassified Beijerinckia]MDH7796824.1 pilus assembly protein CpaC [Beijerinckia sp. GAS462]SEC61335.1 pilus assembly protein CpaC [Beijerinckia sp. 28-YEA-48]
MTFGFSKHGSLAALLGVTMIGASSLLPQHAFAQTIQPQAMERESTIARRLNLGVGKSVILDLPRDASEIFVANPKVANAIVRSARKLYIIAAEGGQTSIFAMDAQGQQIAVIEISVGRDVGELQRILRTAIPGADIVARTVDETIILTGVVDSAGDAQKAMDIANGFLGGGGGAPNAAAGATGVSSGGRLINSLTIRGRDQVMLKVSIAEVQRQVMKQLGVSTATANGSWGQFSMANAFGLQSFAQNGATLGKLNTANAVGAQLQAYERYGVARILAEPTVTAISGETAKFTAGGELPVPQSQTCTPTVTGTTLCTTGITFKNYGVTLNFTPVVLAEGRILLRVATEVTEVDPTQSYVFSGISVPAFRTRKNETSVELPSGGSIASAGLLQSTSMQIINGLPGLMNLPILGTLFRSRDYQRKETELMIIITPYIAKVSKPGELKRPDDGLADASDPQSWLLGRVNRLYSTTSNPQAIKGFRGSFGFIAD